MQADLVTDRSEYHGMSNSTAGWSLTTSGIVTLLLVVLPGDSL